MLLTETVKGRLESLRACWALKKKDLLKTPISDTSVWNYIKACTNC